MKLMNGRIAVRIITLLFIFTTMHNTSYAQAKPANVPEVIVVPQKTCLLEGEKYSADVFLATVNKNSKMKFKVDGSERNVVNGKGKYEMMAAGYGERKWSGILQVPQKNGKIKEYKVPEQTYMVTRPFSSVSPIKMSVLYIGVDNPIDIAAAGYPKDKIRATMNGGEISGSNGAYIARVKQTGSAIIDVSVPIGESGDYRIISETKFRVKRLPQPRVKFFNKSGGNMPITAIRAQNRLFAVIEDFDFDVHFPISRFTMSIINPGAAIVKFESTTHQFTEEMTAAVNTIVPGSLIIFDNVTVTGPDDILRTLDPVVFTAE